MKPLLVRAILCVTCLVLGRSFASAQQQTDKPVRERFEATISLLLAGWDTVSVTIEDFSTDEEMQELAQTFAHGGRDALEDALHKIRKGFLRMGGGGMVTTPIMMALSAPADDGGRRLQIVALQPSHFSPLEGSQISASTRYPYCVVNLNVDEHGNGKGTMLTMVDLVFKQQGHMGVKRFGHPSFQLLNVRSED